MSTTQDSDHRPNAQGQSSVSSGGSGHSSSGGSGQNVRDTTEKLAEQARTQGQEHVQQYREMAADKVDALADSVKAAASQLPDDDVAHLSQHVADMAGGLRRLSDGLREKSADEILKDVRRVARENPTLFIAGSIALGFGITRFAKASAPSGGSSPSNRSSAAMGTTARTGATPGHNDWIDDDSAVPGTTATPFEGNSTVTSTSASGSAGMVGAVPGPAATTAASIGRRDDNLGGTTGSASSSGLGTGSGTRNASSTDSLGTGTGTGIGSSNATGSSFANDYGKTIPTDPHGRSQS